MFGPSTGYPRCFKSCEDGALSRSCVYYAQRVSQSSWKTTGVPWLFGSLCRKVASFGRLRRSIAVTRKNLLHLARYRHEWQRAIRVPPRVVEYTHHARPRQTQIDLDHRTLPRVVIHDRQRTKTAAIRQTIAHEVHAPALIRPRNFCRTGLRASKAFSFPPRHLQPQFLRDPMYPAVPHRDAFALQQCCQTPITKARTLSGQLRNAPG